MNTGQIIEKLGGDDAIATHLGCKPVTIRSWKSRGWIPPHAFASLVAMARKRRVPGINLNTLETARIAGMKERA